MFFSPSARNSVKSSMIKDLEVSPSTCQAVVTYNDGNQYVYCGVDESAIFDVLFGAVDSFGKWVNKNCKDEDVTYFQIATA